MKNLTIGELKKLIELIPNDMSVVLGWQFADVRQAEVETIKINGVVTTGFKLSADEED